MRNLEKHPSSSSVHILILIYIVLLLTTSHVRACIKSSMYYRSQFRSQSHVFVPEEFQPSRPERSLDASGPLEPQDFQPSVPTPRLVRVDGHNLRFASEQAHWMTKGCRDRLLKLVAHVQSTWPNNEVAIRVTRSWMQPPPSAQTNRVQNFANSKPGSSSHRGRKTLELTMTDFDGDKFARLRDRTTRNQGKEGWAIERVSYKTNLRMHKPPTNASLTRHLSRAAIWQPIEPEPAPKQGPRNRDKARWTSYEKTQNHFQKDSSSRSDTDYSSSHNWNRRAIGSENSEESPLDKHLMMEEFHYAGRALDMILVDARNTGDNTMFGSVYPGKLAQIAYYGALFDWCYFSQMGHVHCSVKPDSIITSQWFGCFPGNATANRTDGTPLSLNRLRIGDKLLAYDFDKQTFTPTTVVAFLHRDTDQYAHWIELRFIRSDLRAAQIRLTANHLVYRRNPRLREYSQLETVYAGEISVGDQILGDLQQKDPFCRVIAISAINSSQQSHTPGVYAPLTTSGTIIIDNVLVSCFAHFKEEWLARIATSPLLAYYYIHNIFLYLYTTESIETGVHWYANLILRIAQSLLPEWMFFDKI